MPAFLGVGTGFVVEDSTRITAMPAGADRAAVLKRGMPAFEARGEPVTDSSTVDQNYTTYTVK